MSVIVRGEIVSRDRTAIVEIIQIPTIAILIDAYLIMEFGLEF